MSEPPLLVELRQVCSSLGAAAVDHARFQEALQIVAKKRNICPACLMGKGTVGGPLSPRTCPVCKGEGTFQAGSSSCHG